MNKLRQLSSNDIDIYYKGNPNFEGWHSKDTLPKKIGDKFYIVNMEDSGGEGTHWVAIYNRKHMSIYYDSFGLPPPPDIIRFMKTSRKQLVMTDVQIQNIKSNACGYFCILVIDMLEEGIPFTDIVLDEFSFDTLENENIVNSEKDFKFGETGSGINGYGILNAVRNRIKGLIKLSKTRIKGFLEGPRTIAPPAVRRWIKTNGNRTIFAMVVCRTPVLNVVQNALDVVSLGGWTRAKKRLDYDDLYHLYLFITFNNGTTYRIEKNDVVSIVKTMSIVGDCEPVRRVRGRNITVKDLFENAIKRNPLTFWLYSSKTNNCQVFVKNILDGNGLNTRELNDFVKQDAIKLFERLPPYIEIVANLATDIAGRADVLIKGRGDKNFNESTLFREFKQNFL